MRLFFIAVGVLSWVWALAVLWIFAESGGALTVIAAGVFAGVAIVALGCERILKTLEEIRDGRVKVQVVTPPNDSAPVVVRRAAPAITPSGPPVGEIAL